MTDCCHNYFIYSIFKIYIFAFKKKKEAALHTEYYSLKSQGEKMTEES